MKSGDQNTWSFTCSIMFILLWLCFSSTVIHYGNIGTFYYSKIEVKDFEPCDDRYIHYTPCQGPELFPVGIIRMYRNCLAKEQKLNCLIPAPKGYTAPFPWPKCRDHIHLPNVNVELPSRRFPIDYKHDDLVESLHFPDGVDAYINELACVIPLEDGIVRTALDIRSGYGTLGAYMFNRNVTTMSFSRADWTVQFALERGVPAVIGVLGTLKLPFPSRAFDMVHCSFWPISWSANDGMYIMEVDRILRPGGYWVLASHFLRKNRQEFGWQKINEIAKLLCWEKMYETGQIAIWRKRTNKEYCPERDSGVSMCESTNVNDVWCKKMEPCITSYPETSGSEEVAGGELQPFPERLNALPPRISSGSVPVTSVSFVEDNFLWKKHLKSYEGIIGKIDSGRYRNIMDMNAGLGSFAAALESPKLWVMNVMPTIAEIDTLGVIYERGLIGIYHDWCESFSTFPRTYDLIHANGVFSLYKDKCNAEDILLEMDRILRPGGVVIFQDQVDGLINAKSIVAGMRWNTTMVDHEYNPLVRKKILFAFKQYWVADGSKSTSQPFTFERNWIRDNV